MDQIICVQKLIDFALTTLKLIVEYNLHTLILQFMENNLGRIITLEARVGSSR